MEEHMKHKKSIAANPVSKRSRVKSSPLTGGITPGRVNGDSIELAKGRVASPSYRGPVSIWIDAENHGLLDLHVEHRELPDHDAGGPMLADDPVFGQEVIRVLQQAGTNQSWLHLKSTDPVGWARAVEIDNALRDPHSLCTRGFRQELFVHRSCVPLETIDFERLAPNTLDPMTVGECQGMCGV